MGTKVFSVNFAIQAFGSRRTKITKAAIIFRLDMAKCCLELGLKLNDEDT
jgi:hypothetical protein